MFGRLQKSGPNWIVIIAVILSIALAVLAATRLSSYTSTHVAYQSVPVMAHDVGPYTVLQQGDIAMAQVVKGSQQQGTISSPTEAVGKMTTSPLYQGDQIETNRLTDLADPLIKNMQVVAVNIDLARSVGGSLMPGDTVDAWWIPSDGNTQTPGIGWVQVATDAVVVDIKDSTGKSLYSGRGGSAMQNLVGGQSPSSGDPAVAILAVNTGDVPRIIGGAAPKSDSIVLTKKFNDAQESPVVSQSTPQPNAQQQGGV